MAGHWCIGQTILGQEHCLKAPSSPMRQSLTWYHQPWQLVVDLSGRSWSMCLFYRWSHNGTSCEAGLGGVQPTRSTSFPAWKSCVSSPILVIRPRSWVSHERPHLKPCCSGAMMMLFSAYCMMLLMTVCEDLAQVADDICEGNWSELFWTVVFLKTGVMSVVLRSSGTVLLLNEELVTKVIAGTILFCSWSRQQLLVWNKTITTNMRNISSKKSYPQA